MKLDLIILVPDKEKITSIIDGKGNVIYQDPDFCYVRKNVNGDAIDIYNHSKHTIMFGEDQCIEFFPIILPDGYKADVRPRSSTYREKGITLVNGVGLIDESYRGADDVWKAHILAFKDTKIYINDRLFQFEVMPKMEQTIFQRLRHLFVTGFNIKFENISDWKGVNRGGFGKGTGK